MKKAIIALLPALIIGMLAGCSNNTVKPTVQDAQKWDDVVLASLDGREVKLSDYTYWYRISQNEMENQALSGGEYTEENISAYWDSQTDGVKASDKIQEDSLLAAKQYATLIKIANDAGTTLDPDKIIENEQMIDEVVASFSDDVKVAEQTFLDTYGITPAQMKAVYMGMDIIDQYALDQSEAIEVPDNELIAEYDANKETYEQVIVRHVLILCDDTMTKEAQDEAKKKSDDVYALLMGGADIARLAKEYSEDPGSVDNNGEYIFPRGMMVPEFEDWSFSAQKGDKGIVKTSYGYHIMQFMGRAGYEEAKEQIRQKIVYGQIEKLFSDSLETANLSWETNNQVLNSVKP